VDDERELEVIRQQMEETHESLVDKLEALEGKVRGTVEDVEHAVTHTAEAVKDTVQSVKETLNVSAHVRRHPWLMFGGAVATGFFASCLLGRSRKEAQHVLSQPEVSPGVSAPTLSHNGHNGRNGAVEEEPAKEAEEPGPLQAGLEQLKGLAVGMLLGLLRETLVSAVPKEWSPDVASAMDDVTTRLGGKALDRLEPQEETTCPSRIRGVI